MRLPDTILFSLCVASFIIGVHEIITVGFAQGYWLIMLSSGLLLWYGIRKRRASSSDTEREKKPRRNSKQKNRKKST